MAPFPLNAANGSTPFGGQATMLVSEPFAANELGPSTTAPLRNGGPLTGDATRLVTWCCMHSGNVVPSSTTREVPQALVPKTLASQRLPNAAYVVLLVRLSYSSA